MGQPQAELPDVVGLRPTPDRVRETLFNWLALYIGGAGAGPVRWQRRAVPGGAVRGAAQGQALDASNVAVSSLKEHLGTLRCTTGQVQTADALRYLETQAATEYDVVFLDPPFNQNLLPAVCTLLEERQWLAADAWIYTESETAPSTLGLPWLAPAPGAEVRAGVLRVVASRPLGASLLAKVKQATRAV